MIKKIFTFCLFITLLLLTSCVDNPNNNEEKKYTVTWINEDGEILEVDLDVLEGTIPSYDGKTPSKPATGDGTFVFKGWTPEVSEVKEDVTYYATFEKSTNKYTVTWVNDDGSILEKDIDVLYGTIPSYNGNMPTKPSNGNLSYEFSGWSPEIKSVTENVTYTAKYKTINSGQIIPGIDPVLSNDGKTILYGFYPQTHINDLSIISELNLLTNPTSNGWYLYNNEYYAKIKANVYNNESYLFDDGTEIINGNEYWFKCEPIKWKILKNNNGTYALVSELLLDANCYNNNFDSKIVNGETIYANNYENSTIRNWLNNEFYNTAFAISNEYFENNDIDKISLLSFQDYINPEYGFDENSSNKSITRAAKTTDYARARGAWCNTRDDLGKDSLYNGTYWTNTPANEYYCAWNVNSGGYLSSYVVDGKSHCVRPCITIIFE